MTGERASGAPLAFSSPRRAASAAASRRRPPRAAPCASASVARPRIARSGSSPAWIARATSGNFAPTSSVLASIFWRNSSSAARSSRCFSSISATGRVGLGGASAPRGSARRAEHRRRHRRLGRRCRLSHSGHCTRPRRACALIGRAVGKPALEFVAALAGERELDHRSAGEQRVEPPLVVEIIEIVAAADVARRR